MAIPVCAASCSRTNVAGASGPSPRRGSKLPKAKWIIPVDAMSGTDTVLPCGIADQCEAANSSRSASESDGEAKTPVAGASSEPSFVAVMATERGVETIRKRTSRSEARESMNLGHLGRF